jgi:TPR repeat protein
MGSPRRMATLSLYEATAMFHLGAMWELGIGVKADVGKAHAWYERAASLNDPAARAALKRLGA